MNFTWQDVIGTSAGIALFPLVLLFPGYICGWVFDLFEFKRRLLTTRLAISVLLSVAVSPILYYLISSLLSLNAALIVSLLMAITFVALLIYEKTSLPQVRPWRPFFWVMLGWSLFAIFSLVDLQWGNRQLYFSVASLDHTTRVSIIDAMTRSGVPPVNPSYYPGRPVKLTFLYFFWYILCSMTDIAGGQLVNARSALIASIIWCGIALMALIAFYLRQRDGGVGFLRRAMFGIALLSVSGLDVLPAIALMRYGNGALGDLEHWNEQITAWIGSLFWVPHHVAGLIAGIVGILLAHSARGQSRTKQYVTLTFSGMAFASALGLSVWVTLLFVIFWGLWILFVFLQKEHRSLTLPMIFAGVIAFLLAGTFLLGLLSGSGGGGTTPVVFDVRSFRLADPFLANSSFLWKSLVRLALLPINYFFELGFFFLVAFLWFKKNKADLYSDPYKFTEILLLAVSFILGTFARSTLIENNDLGWRVWLPGQFVLLIWGVDAVDGILNASWVVSPRTKYNLVLLAALGISTTVLDVTLLRFAYYFSFGSEAGRQIYSARQAYTMINETMPEDVIVQYNPSGTINRPSGLYGMRQSAISDRTAYGIPADVYSAKAAAVGEIFKMENVQNWDLLDALCSEHFIDVIVIVDSDLLWRSLGLLEKQRPALYADDYTSVFTCGTRASPLLTP
ncbi:MAG: hypothetical protein HY864_08440 [Chloroflexi bacterium]|nr:hypothetical protein [Chloroflexota bacterium]